MLTDATHVQTSWINASEHYRIYDELQPIEDTVFEDMKRGEVFRWLQREYGACTSKVYVDTPDQPRAIGWVFEKRVPYDDSRETYLQQTWVSFLKEIAPATSATYESVGIE